MAEITDTDFLSIGEVLGLLLEEFPDVTISKIRFLESQGLIDPERTPSGYRKFYDADVDLLRVILREQRENYLPLRVIKDRLDSGAIDPSGEVPKPPPDDTATAISNGDLPVDRGTHDVADHSGAHAHAEVLSSSITGHPAGSRKPQSPADGEPAGASPPADRPAAGRPASGGAIPDETAATDDHDHTPVVPRLLPGVLLDRQELCAMVGMTAAQLDLLEQFGIVSGRGSGTAVVYGDDAVETAKLAVQFMAAGVEPRHLRGWRTAAEREASLYEQLITPRLRQRNPEARADALDQLRRLDALGARLRDAMMRSALRHHFES